MGAAVRARFDAIGVIIIYCQWTCHYNSFLRMIYIYVGRITLISQMGRSYYLTASLHKCRRFINSIFTCSLWPLNVCHRERLLWLADSLGQNSSPVIQWTLISTELCARLLLDARRAIMTWGQQLLSISLTGTILFTSIPHRLKPFTP